MAKQLISKYTFDPSTNTVTVDNVISLDRFLIITNVTRNETIYLFNDSVNGIQSYSNTLNPETTILELKYDCSAMSSSDILQIFVEFEHTSMEPSETFIDPVNKLRVSNPQNLIDTDFEYGLQSTKWETLELSNNVPSYYVSDSDLPLDIIDTVSVTEGSDVVIVRCREPHGLVVGTPIDVRGLTSRTAEGKFLISAVQGDTVFTYKGTSVQSSTSIISNIYTTITPGQFYSGSQIPFDISTGITTNERDPSTLTISTQYPHGYQVGSNFYLVNTVGTKQVQVTRTSEIAPDGRPFVDFENTLSTVFTPDLTQTETKQVKATYSLKFSSNSVDTTNNRIVWSDHSLRNNDCLLYVPSSGDEEIGGLQRFQVYYIRNPQQNTFQLSSTYNGTPISFTSSGTYNFGRATFNLCYEIYRIEKPSNNWSTYYYTYAGIFGSNNNSGWDFRDSSYNVTNRGNMGIGQKLPSGKIIFTPTGTFISTTALNQWYGTSRNSQMVMPETSNTPGIFNFIEDWTRYQRSNNYSFRTENITGQTTGFYSPYDNQFSSFGGSSNQTFGRGQVFAMLLEDDQEGDTIFATNHGLEDGAEIEIADLNPPDPGAGPSPSTDILGDLISLAQSLGSTSASPSNLGGIANTINSQAFDFNVFAIATDSAMAENLVGIASPTGVHPGNQAGFVYNTGNGNFLGTGSTISGFSGGSSRGYSAADNNKWMAAAMYANNSFQGLMVWILTGDDIDQNDTITPNAYSITRTADIFYPDVGNYDFHRIYSFVIDGSGVIQSTDLTGNQGWRFTNNQSPQITGYQSTNSFASDDGSWAFVQNGGKVDGNTPGPDYKRASGYGFGNYNSSDFAGHEFYWNGSSLGTSGYVGFIFTGDGNGGIVGDPSGLVARNSVSTNLYDTSADLQLPYGTYIARVVDENRFQIADTNGTAYRLVAATGEYEITGQRQNPTANSFYASGHGYNGGETVEVSVIDGGVLPLANTGAIIPRANVSTGTTDEAWKLTDTYLTDYVNNNAFTRQIVLSPFSGSTQYISSGVASGNSSRLSYFQSGGGYIFDQQIGTSANLNNSVQSSGGWSSQEVREYGDSPYESSGYGVIGTDFQTNTAVDHFSWLMFGNDSNSPHEYRQYTYAVAQVSWSILYNTSNQTITSSTGDSAWKFTASVSAINGDSTYQGQMVYHIRVWNDNWFGSQFHYDRSTTSSFNYQYIFGTGGGYFTLVGMIGLDNNTSLATVDLQNFATGYAQYIADSFAFPDLLPGSSQSIEVVDANRFRLASPAGFSLDIADHGTPTLTFTERGVIGALDGAYTVSTIPDDTSFSIDLSFSAPATTLTFNANTIANDLIVFLSPHNFTPGTPVLYFNNGNPDISGIVNDTEYFVSVIDDLHIGLSNSYEDAINNTYNALTASASAENHQIRFSVVNGRLPGNGSVTTEENSRIVRGNDETLFKRYFKVGDTISIKNNNSTPGTISDFIIQAIADDQTLEVTDIIPFAASNTLYFLQTSLYARPDGYSVHRPFDGGVEIAAGTSPFSQIRRQTRKYFRYQSGKGIQTSLAINFNPPVQFETLTSRLDTGKTDKCVRDIGYFIDGVGYDVALGTNYNGIFLGIAESNSLDINQTVLNAIEAAKNRTLEVAQVADSATATTRVTEFFDEILNISENGRGVASSYVFTNPTDATVSRIAAKDKILANIDFITAEINAYVEVNYAPTDHDISKCTRDIKYALYSFAYDILYGGNSATYDNARFFYYFDTANNPGIDPSHKQQTVDAYDHLGAILGNIVQGNAITPSTGNTEVQNVSGNNASSGDAAVIDELANIIRRVVRYGAATLEGTGNAETLFVTNSDTAAYVINGEFNNQALTVVRGVTYTFDIDSVGHPFWIKTAATTGTTDQYNTGVTNNGTENGIITWTVDPTTPNTLYYQCEIHSAMGAEITVVDAPTKTYPSITWASTELQDAKNDIDSEKTLIVNFSVPDIYSATGLTKYPHRLSPGQSIFVNGSTDNAFNGDFFVNEIIDEFTFTFTLDRIPQSSIPNGIVQYNLNGYNGAYTRAGMFDMQNGFFFEYNGTELFCVRRSSTQQLSGTVRVSNNSNLVVGTNTNFFGQLNEQDKIVIRGGTYKVVKIIDRNNLIIQPQYKGISASNVILTLTQDVKVPQREWNLDTSDGYGPSGFNLNINKIQMAYMDYSWYGAGKVRFGFKDRAGHVKYVHEFLHNNILDEAYMRSGNIPAAYEIENDQNPSYAPTLFHWGTSVIMDGRFDEDDAYLFTATSNTLTFTNGQSNTSTTNENSRLVFVYNRSARSYDWWVELSFPSADAGKFSSGTPLYTAGGELNGEIVDYTQFQGGSIKVYIYITRSRSFPSVYPIVSSGVAVSIGAPASGGASSDISLGTAIIPLVTLRLAPSVDSSLSGELGAREIINRMQLKLNEVGLILTHDCEVSMILNGDLSSINWENVNSPSLSQLIRHEPGDKIAGGVEVFSFRASGGSVDNEGKRLANTSNFPLGSLIDMGNSILGGNGTFPNGPDILTVAVKLVNTSDVSANSPFISSARITWSESQA